MNLKEIMRRALFRARLNLLRPSVILKESDSEADKEMALKWYMDKISKIHEQVSKESPNLSQAKHDEEVSRRLKAAGL
jgi:hypothetical protein